MTRQKESSRYYNRSRTNYKRLIKMQRDIKIMFGLLFTMVLLVFASAYLNLEATPEENMTPITEEQEKNIRYDCEDWNNNQCLDAKSDYFGCEIEERVCYNYSLM